MKFSSTGGLFTGGLTFDTTEQPVWDVIKTYTVPIAYLHSNKCNRKGPKRRREVAGPELVEMARKAREDDLAGLTEGWPIG